MLQSAACTHLGLPVQLPFTPCHVKDLVVLMDDAADA